MRKQLSFLLVLILGLVRLSPAQFQVGSVTVTPATLAGNLNVPWELVWGSDNFIWMTERPGFVSRVDPATGQVTRLLTIPDVQQLGESGLLGMALHPNFSQNPYVYVVYTYNKNGTFTEKLVRYTYNGTSLTAPQILLDDIAASTNHDGARLLILPDQTLLVTTGDASNTATSQNLNSLNGKVLRLNLDGTVPANNPIPGSYVYSFGHRNAQGLVRNPNGLLYSSEHGPGSDDELNIIEANRNYGWPHVNGFCDSGAEQAYCTANNVKEPIAAWTPTLAVAGIAFYDHAAIPEWQNSVLMTTLKASQLVQIKLNAAGTAVISQSVYLNGVYGRLRSICVSPAGKVYIGTSNKDGRGTIAANNDRILVLENLAFSPTGFPESPAAAGFTLTFDADRQLLHLKFPAGATREQVTLHNLTGRQLATAEMSGNREASISTRQLAGGLYLVKAGNKIKKVILP